MLQALYIVFLVQPWHHNIARSLQQAPKVYFYDTGMVGTQERDALSDNERTTRMGALFENASALMLLRNTPYQQDGLGRSAGLPYLRTKDGAQIDFALSSGTQLTHMIACKWTDTAPARAFTNVGQHWPQAKAIQLVRHLPKAEH